MNGDSDTMKRILSYLFPFTRKIKTDFNGELEINWINGKRYLDSKNANYSYGALQRVLEFGLRQINPEKVTNVLLLGMGGGSVIRSLREQFAIKGIVTAVEIDKVIIELASEEFNVIAGNELRIINQDAFEFIASCEETFSLVIIDLFIDNRVPDKFYSGEFWNQIIEVVSKKGFLIFNSSVLETDKEKVSEICKMLQGKFRLSVFENVEGANTLITGEKIQP